MKVLKFIILFLVPVLAFLLSATGYSQSRLSGKLTDRKGLALSNANITLTEIGRPVILAYAITDEFGEFEMTVENPNDSLLVKVTYIGFETWEQVIRNEDQHLEIKLKESASELKEVFIKSLAIQRRGDTLNYSVAAFKDQKDRVIADVLAKMPGIEVRANGSILYQGKPILKYYIEGLDLLEGRYALANNNISADAVSKIQIMENHQPIKLLDSLVFSEKASLNIKLKNNTTITANAEVGAGISPLLWNANITPMVFSKKQQAIFSYQSNNIGKQVSDQLNDFSVDFGERSFNNNKKNWLALREVSNPPFSEERWLDNNVHLGSANYLVKLQKDLDLKVNISYLNDVQNQKGTLFTTLFSPVDTISFTEDVQDVFFLNSLKTNLILERNTEKNYLKNELRVDAYWDSGCGTITQNNEAVDQRLENPYSAFSNSLKLLKPIGKQLVSLKSNTGYSKAPQKLQVRPGPFQNILNNGNEYEEVNQNLEVVSFFSDNSVGFTKAFKNLSLSPAIGFSIQDQEFESSLTTKENNFQNELGIPFKNKLNVLNVELYLKTEVTYDLEFWKIRLDLPFSFQSHRISYDLVGDSQSVESIVFDPRLFIKKELSPFLDASFSIGVNKDYGGVENLFRGYILNSPRNIQRYDSPLLETLSWNYTGNFSYRNALKSLFATASYTYGKFRSNLLYSYSFDASGATIFEAVPDENFSNAHTMSLRGSKYFTGVNTSLSLGGHFSLRDSQQLLNSVPTDIRSKALQFDLKVDSEITSWFSLNYKSEFSFYKSLFGDQKSDWIKSSKHIVDLSFYLFQNQYLGINTELYLNKISGGNNTSEFLNLKYNYSFKESGFDLNLSWYNVLETEEFINIYNNDFSYIQNTFQLRPAQVFLGLQFSF